MKFQIRHYTGHFRQAITAITAGSGYDRNQNWAGTRAGNMLVLRPLELSKNTQDFMPLTERHFWFYLLGALIIKLMVAYWLPMTGDEVYFIQWGRHLDYGYYDHPPMVGWFLAAMLQFSDAAMWLRLPQILTTTFIAWAIYRILSRSYAQTAVMISVLYMLAPINMLGVLITTDTPLLLWSFLSGLAFYQSQRRDSMGWYLLCGILLGLAFFSKFFAGLLGVAYFLYLVLFVRRGIQPYLGLLLIIAGTLPFIFLNLLWNYNHCWDNYLFNLFNRTEGSSFSFKLTWKYILTLVYLLTPPIVYFYFKHQATVRAHLWGERGGREGVFIGLFVVPFGLFFILSFWVSIGLHWLLSFYPFVFLGMAGILNSTALRKSFYFMLPFTTLHLLAFVVIVVTAPGLFKDNENTYKDVVYGMYSSEILEKLQAYESDYILATDSYTESALLAYASGKHVIVIGKGSHHARQDDIITDLRELEGKNIVLVSYSPKLDSYRDFFEKAEIKPLPIAETEFYYLLGQGFKFKAYREQILEETLSRFYTIPDFLPVGQCYMHERYGKAQEQK
ncbi:MAG: glycosyltransferase family 39 protein [Gammaproteobacteria bacterium]|nr:glycosyltransferase family 39 protein [Gammaproteobacteria bacterium]